jgi:hypothetical protein
MKVLSCKTCQYNEVKDGLNLCNYDFSEIVAPKVSRWIADTEFDQDLAPINPTTSCPGWVPDETKSCRERGDDYQNCNTCPDVSCGDNTNPMLKEETKSVESENKRIYYVCLKDDLYTREEAKEQIREHLRNGEGHQYLMKAVSITSMTTTFETKEIK